jgi:CHAD domain-containing protein
VVGIHQLRTATRRLRSQLRTLGILVDLAWKQETEIELKWLASVLGSVRDLDVLEERLNERLDGTETSIPAREALTPIFERLATRRIQAIQHLKVALASERYLALKHRLERAMIERPWIERATPTCREALGPLAASAWRKLKKHAHKLGQADHDEAFHDVRKLAKRARYTSELVAPLIGRAQSTSARGFVRVTTRVQKTLGEHHDSAMLIAELQAHTREHEGSVAFSIAAQTLIDAEKARSRRARKAFFQEWDKLDRKKWRAWMKPKARVKV